ncbi:DUF4245 domain-containing protein [Streptomyces sp. NPDC002004]
MAGRNGKQTVRGLLQSMAVVGLFAGVVYYFGIPHDDTPAPVRRVDFGVELQSARRAAPYPVAAPEGLPGAWKATSVRFQGDAHYAWHLGFLDPDEQYVAVEQSTDKPARFIDEASHGAKATKATQEIDGRTWRRYEGPKYDALVLEEKGSTTLVTGTASFGGLTKMAESLKAS